MSSIVGSAIISESVFHNISQAKRFRKNLNFLDIWEEVCIFWVLWQLFNVAVMITFSKHIFQRLFTNCK